MAGNPAIVILLLVILGSALALILLLFLLRRRTGFKRRRADALNVLEGGSSRTSSSASVEKQPIPEPIKRSQPPPRQHNHNKSQMSISSIVMTAALAGPGIAKPSASRTRPTSSRKSMVAGGEPGPEFEELGLPLPPAIGEATKRNSRGSKTWSMLSVNSWKKRNTVRLTWYAM